ncbi:Checkpoint kinase 2 [Nowakowskiella sp. JEL0407]|nr:Checkpoint kinase 2 [Nowakowskiella sp. JEL0407]
MDSNAVNTIVTPAGNVYRIEEQLGKGKFGVVNLITNITTSIRYALKRIKINNPTQRNEIDILSRVKHSRVVELYEFFELNGVLYLIMEFMGGGELFDRITSIEKFSESDSKIILIQLILVIKYLHSLGISHRDLKPENVLLNSNDKYDLKIKVTDFGLSKVVSEEEFLKTIVGTLSYCAPEVLAKSKNVTYTKKVDIWAAGVILYICLSGLHPFDHKNQEITKAKIQNGILDFPDGIWGNITMRAKDLVKKMLVVNPQTRISAEGVLQHPFMMLNVEERLNPAVVDLLDPQTSSITTETANLATIPEDDEITGEISSTYHTPSSIPDTISEGADNKFISFSKTGVDDLEHFRPQAKSEISEGTDDKFVSFSNTDIEDLEHLRPRAISDMTRASSGSVKSKLKKTQSSI